MVEGGREREKGEEEKIWNKNMSICCSKLLINSISVKSQSIFFVPCMYVLYTLEKEYSCGDNVKLPLLLVRVKISDDKISKKEYEIK